MPKRKDPFNFNKTNDKQKKDENKTGDDSFSTSTSSRVNNVKYSRLPNGMILNHDKDSLKK